MARVKGGSVARDRRKKILKQAKGYYGRKQRIFKTVQEQDIHTNKYAFKDRKQNIRNFRKLWITRINAACRENEISYSKFINGLTKAGLVINRKMISEIANDSPATFTDLVAIAKDALEGKEYKAKAVKLESKAKDESATKTVKKETQEEKKPVAKKVTTEKKTETKKSAAKTTTTEKVSTTKKATAAKTATKSATKTSTKKTE